MSLSIYMYEYVLPVFYVVSNIGNFLSAVNIFFKKTWKKNVCVFYFKISLLYNSCYITCGIDVLMIILCIFAFKNVRRIRAIPREKRHQIRSMTKKDFQLLRCLFVD